MSAGGSHKAILAALGANLGVAVGKFAAFLVTGAASMLAEAIHSVADSANQVLLLFGWRQAGRAPTEEHPFGFGRERYFWSFVVALVLFTLGGVFALAEGVDKLRHPHDVEDVGVAIAMLGLAIVLEGFSLRTAVRESRPAKGDLSWWRFIRTSRSPELPVVLLEDSGALAGLTLAILAVSAAAVTGNADFDALGTLGIGALLLVIAAILMVEMKGLLIGESALPGELEAIRAAVETTAAVRSVIHLRTEHLGPDDVLVGVKIELDPHADMLSVAGTINAAERAIRQVVPAARMIYVEPDVRAMGATDTE